MKTEDSQVVVLPVFDRWMVMRVKYAFHEGSCHLSHYPSSCHSVGTNTNAKKGRG
jgi:hypothetical protein